MHSMAWPALPTDYQRTRVERVCARLGLVSLAFLWHQPQVGWQGLPAAARTPSCSPPTGRSQRHGSVGPCACRLGPGLTKTCSWPRQAALLRRMIDAQIDAILVKIAAAGLTPRRHLGARLATLPAQVGGTSWLAGRPCLLKPCAPRSIVGFFALGWAP